MSRDEAINLLKTIFGLLYNQLNHETKNNYRNPLTPLFNLDTSNVHDYSRA